MDSNFSNRNSIYLLIFFLRQQALEEDETMRKILGDNARRWGEKSRRNSGKEK